MTYFRRSYLACCCKIFKLKRHPETLSRREGGRKEDGQADRVGRLSDVSVEGGAWKMRQHSSENNKRCHLGASTSFLTSGADITVRPDSSGLCSHFSCAVLLFLQGQQLHSATQRAPEQTSTEMRGSSTSETQISAG